MIIQIWNIRGVGNQNSQQLAAFYKKTKKIDFLFLLEPMVSLNAPKYCRLLGFNSIVANISNKIWVCTTAQFSINILKDDEQFLHCEIKDFGTNSSFYATVVYAKCTIRERRDLWAGINNFFVPPHTPWCVGGDFNIVTSVNEREGGGGNPPDLSAMSDFNACIMQSGLKDLGFSGPPFTWERPDGMKQRLDRILFNSSWETSFQRTVTIHGVHTKVSDHRPIFTETFLTEEFKKGPFKFQNMWLLHSSFLSEVNKNWNIPARTFGLKKLKEKLFRLKQFLIFWNKHTFGNIFQNLIQLESDIAQVEEDVFENPSPENTLLLKEKLSLFELTLDQEEAYWKQKASATWFVEGERNTALFHNMVKRKKARMRINAITFEDSLITDCRGIKDSAINYFSSHFAPPPVVLDPPSLCSPPCLVSESQCASLCSPPSLDELKLVVFGLKPNSSPGPDGFTGIFFQKCWDIIKDDLLEGVIDFFSGSDLPLGFSHTLLALIPKTQSPACWGDFRPISLCSTLLKIISKIINDRLAYFLPDLISVNQSGFVKDRSISDNILLAKEFAFAVDTKVRGSNVLIKLDMMKAYDRVNWDFLVHVLSSFGFNSGFTHLLMRIVSACQYSLLINGEVCGFIHATQGLRQGDPLSPALFILMNEYLSRSLNSLFERNPQMFFKVPKGLPVSHLDYADDCIIFCNGGAGNLTKLKVFLTEYENQTGQKVNLSKSGFLPGKRANVGTIGNILGMQAMSFPFIYLGAPIVKGRQKKLHFLTLLDKVRSKLSGWNLSLLSQGSRLCLIKSVLNAIPVYLLQVLDPPKSVIQDLKRIFSNFFWGGTVEKSKMHWGTWDRLCYPLDETGLDVINLSDV